METRLLLALALIALLLAAIAAALRMRRARRERLDPQRSAYTWNLSEPPEGY